METGAGFPEQFGSSLRMRDAGLPPQEKSLELAGSQKSLKVVDVPVNMRKLLGSPGGTVRQDVLVAEAVNGPLGSDGDQKARVTYIQAK